MLSYNPEQQTWFNPNIEFVFDEEIIEYDIRDAGFSICKEYKLLPQTKIQELAAMGKDDRHRAIGMLQKDKEFSNQLQAKFAEARKMFIWANKLTDDTIISVKKDAIFTIGKCRRRNFGEIVFAQKNRYSSYIRLPNLRNVEFYYGPGQLDVKQIGDTACNRHRLFLLDFVQNVIQMIEQKKFNPLKRYISTFIDDFKFGRVSEEYYLEFSNISKDPNPIHNYQQLIVPITQIALKEMM